MESLEAELERARALDTDDVADAVESIGFECTRCGACCTSEADESHTATVFPDEVRELQGATGDDRTWNDVARPMPYGLDEGEGQTFEWALQTDGCGDCTFYAEDEAGVGACTVHEDRPLICRTYPFSVALGGTSQPMGEAVDSEGMVRAHECEGLGREISREDAEALAGALKERAIRELEEAIGVRENYRPAEGSTVVHDSEGPKRPDGREIGDTTNRGDTHE
ncbi:YkgJ family cysteine cluster protein [Halalkalicoccus sp. NIPERK01]|uniref:YkgJ family cysteine cluster protein n=1 Tax=Halalkalicoccus sp. NIPERK01 TaxID=3053469 RepID=UPI00256F15CE|nr:YkgJ family cysteine cluster protein [Halalkalicoccus sp. NIPERK01]MDL5361944.1 YkgJ family cysteine cluster protein [Halalkalicoccus sp. NIPERK01]